MESKGREIETSKHELEVINTLDSVDESSIHFGGAMMMTWIIDRPPPLIFLPSKGYRIEDSRVFRIGLYCYIVMLHCYIINTMVG